MYEMIGASSHLPNPAIWRLPDVPKLASTTSDVRQAAAKTLGQLGELCAVEPLIATLRDQDSSVRQAAAAALGQLGDPRAARLLLSILEDPEKDE